jgi:beta-glucosidase
VSGPATEFLWGAATSSHQVEGGNDKSDWWEYEATGQLPHESGDCCRHFELYERDFDLLSSWGHNAHRFSIEWSRIEPEEGQWNDEAISHYSRVIRALRERGVEPVVTLHHFTNPAWFTRRGGWERRDSSALFARFVEHLLVRLEGSVTFWLTINEPNVYVMQGYVNCEWPPLERALLEAPRVLRNLARAHLLAYDLIKGQHRDAQVGFAHNAVVMEPCKAERGLDRFAARMRDRLLNGAFFKLIGCPLGADARGGKLDFLGINYYTRCCVRFSGWGLSALLGRACHLDHHPHSGPRSAMGWEMYPRGLGMVLERYGELGVPLLVTENGIATDDDELRCEFLIAHLEEIARAMERGADVFGYLHWSLMDNFEWAFGREARFGLAETDYDTFERTARPSAELFARVCRGGAPDSAAIAALRRRG